MKSYAINFKYFAIHWSLLIFTMQININILEIPPQKSENVKNERVLKPINMCNNKIMIAQKH